MTALLFDFNRSSVREKLLAAEFGMERESLRVNPDGTLAHTPHPFGEHKNIDRDFCENQLELISDVFPSADALTHQLNSLQDEIYAALEKNGELLWPFSNPPRVSGEDDIPVAQFLGRLQSKSVYREYLARKYGKRKMLFSGIHLNFSFTSALLRESFESSKESDFTAYKNQLYLRLSKQLVRYVWLVVYLTAASPVTDPSFGVESLCYASPRCGAEGYWNSFVPILDYTSLDAYLDSIERYIVSGALKSVSELYYPVRLKPRGANTPDALRQNGVNHLELRVLDVNPLSRVGIFEEDIRFIHLLLLYLSAQPDFDFDEALQRRAIGDIQTAALLNPTSVKERAEETLRDIECFTAAFFPEFTGTVAYQQKKLIEGSRYAERVAARFADGYIEEGAALARAYAGGQRYV